MCPECKLEVTEDGEVRVGGVLVGHVNDDINAVYRPACMTIDLVSRQLVVKENCLAQKKIGGG